MKERGISYKRECSLLLNKKDSGNRADFVIENKIIVEFKAKNFIEKEDYYQLKRYLIIRKMQLGLLVNFRDKYIKPRRILA